MPLYFKWNGRGKLATDIRKKCFSSHYKGTTFPIKRAEFSGETIMSLPPHVIIHVFDKRMGLHHWIIIEPLHKILILTHG